jgi:hypothetical protein
MSLGLMACEDGPNQTYSPATGTLFNSGGTLGVTDDASAPLDGSYSAQSKAEICGGQQLQEEWSKMVQAPIAPPRFYAGLDLAGGDKFPGLTLQQAENGPLPLPETTTAPSYITGGPDKLCQATTVGPGGNGSDCGTGTSIAVYWGNNQEVNFEYCVATQKALFVELEPGYTGHMKWSYVTPSDGNSYDYDMQIGQQIIKQRTDKSQPATKFIVHWSGTNDTAQTDADIDELYNGIVSTFAPDIFVPPAPGTNCKINGTCLILGTGNQDGTGETVFGFRPASLYFQTFNPTLPQPSGSTLGAIYTFNVKLAPYSVSNSYLTQLTCPYKDPITGTTFPCPYDQSLPGPLFGSSSPTVQNIPGLTANNGPISYIEGIGDKKVNCLLKLGGTYGDLVQNCVQVYNDAATNTTALNKVLGNLTHDDQNFQFSVVGINQNYRPDNFDPGESGQFDILSDTDLPAATATADDFQSDVRTYGPIMNDQYPYVTAAGAVVYKKDYHGMGAVMKEYQKLVQTKLAQDYVTEFAPKNADGSAAAPKALHDPSCLMTPADEANPGAFRPAPGCTGFEGFVDDGPSDGPDDVFNSGPLSPLGIASFKPGGPAVIFCIDAGSDPTSFTHCGGATVDGDLYGIYSDLLSGSLQAVTQYMGNGDLFNVPLEGRDIRFYFKEWSIAMAKYFQSGESLKRGPHVNCNNSTGKIVCAGPPEAVSTANIDAVKVDTDYLIFDSIGGGASRSENIYLGSADLNNDPLDMELRFILVGSNWQNTNFYKRLDREERTLFNSLALDETQASWGYLHDPTTHNVITNDGGFPVVNANVFLSNVFGSPAVSGIWSGNDSPVPDPNYVNPCDPSLKIPPTPTTLADGGAGPAVSEVDAYYCATHVADGTNNCAPGAPVDQAGNPILRENGKMLMDGYCGIFNPTAFALGSVSPMVLKSTDEITQTAHVLMPNFENPYDTSTTNHPIEVLVPWLPQQEGVGFPVSANGSEDVFVETAQLDFTGQVVTPIFDYLPVTTTDDAGVSTTHIQIEAVETEDFLGDVFLCYDQGSAANRALIDGAPGDILNAHMYTSVETILNWITSHPGAQDACGIIVRYSPFNNYPDYIDAVLNGVRLNIEQGSGFGRVSDATIYVPGSGTPAAP